MTGNPSRPRSLRSRMILSTTLLLAALSVVIIAITGVVMRSYLMTGLDQRLDSLADRAAAPHDHGGASIRELPYLKSWGAGGCCWPWTPTPRPPRTWTRCWPTPMYAPACT
ncbi:hypothetical protein ABZ372_26415, partial [Streptomyces sp. NPDC005921]